MSFPKNILKGKWTKAIIFIVVLILINEALIFLLCPRGIYERSNMKDMYCMNENPDVVFAGSSYTTRGINTDIMDEKLQKNTLDYAFDGQIYIGTYYSLKELFKYHKPQTIALSTDWNNYTCSAESEKYYGGVYLNMKPSLNKLEYYVASSEQNNSFLSRYFLWTKYHCNKVSDLIGNIKSKLTVKYRDYPHYGNIDGKDTGSKYMKKGFIDIDPSKSFNRLDSNKLGKMESLETGVDDIKPENIEYFKKIAALCRENNCNLMLVQFPIPVYEIFKEKNYFDFNQKISDIAKEEDVPYYNFNLVKSDIFKTDISDFHDRFHLNGKGAKKFSDFFADFLNKKSCGEDVDNLFETPDDYFNSIDYINNTWFDAKKEDGNKILLKADSFHGPKVSPEYQFVLTDLDDSEEKVLSDYSENTDLTIDKPNFKDYKIRVNAREKGSNRDYSCYYEQEF
ncbi:hypothetical protein [Clostridium sp. BJN0001]|uniref:hypothetical protein n=1 Tax=Clostridium sp. BJN0001 TaxID=2930219 RepID=UPI001FD1A176|nr:hypothetical protein [Clostridium sp. BJN0001]